MFIQKKNSIPNKLHPYSEGFLLKGRDLGPANRHHCDLREKLLIKYSPKHYRSFEMETLNKSRKVLVLKRMKKIGSVAEKDSKFCSKNLWRIIFQNKFKCVDTYHHNPNFYQEKNISRYKAFSKITKIRLFNESDFYKKQSRQPSLARTLLRFLPGMSNLKSLHLLIISEKDFYLLEKVNILTSVLPRLKTLQVECSQIDDINILPVLFKNQNILKYVTHLTLGPIAEENSCEMFKLLPKHCKNLAYLSFKVCKNTDSSYLKVLKDFERLEGIRISVYDTWAFMESFTAPSSIKFINLSFLDTPYAKCEIAQNFFGRFHALKNLVSLELSAQDAPRAANSILSFINSLLSGIPSKLQNLQFTLLHQKASSFETISLNMKDFFLSIKSFTWLKTLKISIPTDHFVNMSWGEVRDINFPQLSSFEFSGKMLPIDLTIQNFFNIAKRSLFSVPATVDFSLRTCVFDSELFELLKILKISPSFTQVNARIWLRVFPQEKEIQDFVQKEKKLPKKNVTLSFGPYPYHRSEEIKLLTLLSQVFGEVSFQAS